MWKNLKIDAAAQEDLIVACLIVIDLACWNLIFRQWRLSRRFCRRNSLILAILVPAICTTFKLLLPCNAFTYIFYINSTLPPPNICFHSLYFSFNQYWILINFNTQFDWYCLRYGFCLPYDQNSVGCWSFIYFPK